MFVQMLMFEFPAVLYFCVSVMVVLMSVMMIVMSFVFLINRDLDDLVYGVDVFMFLVMGWYF